MSVPFLDLKRQYESIGSQVEAKTLEVLRSGAYIGGKYVREFEQSVGKYLGVKHVISCANGTDALTLALRAADVRPGDEVITTPFTFFATAEAIASVGAVPIFADIHKDNYNIDVSKIESAVTKKTKVIMPVHIFGTPCDMDSIMSIAKKHNLKVIEDAAQAIGSEYKGRKIGTTADISCFSFYPTKNLGAFGDAGMVTTNDDRTATILLALREHGAAKNGAAAREYLYGIRDEFAADVTDPGDNLYNPYKYFNYIIGYNSRLDAIQAAILNIKLRRLDGYNAERQLIAERYAAGLSGTVILPLVPENVRSCYHQYAIRTDKKEALSAFLSSKGIGTGAFYPVALHLQKAFEYLGYKPGSLPAAEEVASQTVCLPIFPGLTVHEVDEVISRIIEFMGGGN